MKPIGEKSIHSLSSLSPPCTLHLPSPSPHPSFPSSLSPSCAMRAACCVIQHVARCALRVAQCAIRNASLPFISPQSVAAFLPLLFIPTLHSPPPVSFPPSLFPLLSFSLLRDACCVLRAACCVMHVARCAMHCARCVLRVACCAMRFSALHVACCVLRMRVAVLGRLRFSFGKEKKRKWECRSDLPQHEEGREEQRGEEKGKG